MGVATKLVFDGGEVGTAFIEWKWLTDAVDRLHALCLQLDVTPLGQFGNSSRNNAIRVMFEEEVIETEQEMEAEIKGDGYYLPDGQLLWHTKDQWFAPDDGLKTTEALLAYFDFNPTFLNEREDDGSFAEGMIYILGALKNFLEKGREKGYLFHLQTLC